MRPESSSNTPLSFECGREIGIPLEQVEDKIHCALLVAALGEFESLVDLPHRGRFGGRGGLLRLSGGECGGKRRCQKQNCPELDDPASISQELHEAVTHETQQVATPTSDIVTCGSSGAGCGERSHDRWDVPTVEFHFMTRSPCRPGGGAWTPGTLPADRTGRDPHHRGGSDHAEGRAYRLDHRGSTGDDLRVTGGHTRQVVRHPEYGVPQPALERLVVAELLEQFRVVLHQADIMTRAERLVVFDAGVLLVGVLSSRSGRPCPRRPSRGFPR